MPKRTENRDPERRRASKKAYYERNKERLRAKARERGKEVYHTNARARRAHYRAVLSYRTLHAHGLHIRRLNLYRKAYIEKHGVDGFRAHFVPQLSPAARAEIPRGLLLEDWEDDELREAFEDAHLDSPESSESWDADED